MNTNNPTQFPTGQGFSQAQSSGDIKINGMKVLFDEKVDLMPVTLMRKPTQTR